MMYINTRPDHEPLLQQLQDDSVSIIHRPMIELEPVSDEQYASTIASTFSSMDWIMFVSPAAVRFSRGILTQLWHSHKSTMHLAAIGQATQTELMTWVDMPVLVPDESYTSEALLSLPQLHSLEGLSIAIVGAEGGRTLLNETLSARGAHVHEWHVYTRACPKQVDPIPDGPLAIICTSITALTHFVSLYVETGQVSLAELSWLVSSERIKHYAVTTYQIDSDTIVIMNNASNEAIARHLKGTS